MPPKQVTKKKTAQDARSVFASLPDEAFFCGDAVQHVYLYGVVDATSLKKLRADVDEASKGKVDEAGNALSPLPIVLHINSPGGSVVAGFSMMSVFNECRVPICACVDGISYSAGTFVSILAPYRVMTPMATCLVHEYSNVVYGKQADIKFKVQEGDVMDATMTGMYARRTRIGVSQLAELMKRDLVLPVSECLKLGICDRVLSLSSSHTSHTKVPTNVMLRKTNLNQVRFDCTDTEDHALGAVQRLDSMLSAGPPGALKPVVIHADALSCLSRVATHIAPIAARLMAMGRVTDTYGVVDTHVTLVNMIPILFCQRRVMYEHARVIVHMVYDIEWGWMLRDIVTNTQTMLDIVRAVLRARTRMPADLIADLDKRRFMLSAADCLRYGLVDEVVRV
jgi:ATP-dependent protease ClpP protease subunit